MAEGKRLVVVGADEGPESEGASLHALFLFGKENVAYNVVCVRQKEATVGQMFALPEHADALNHHRMVHNERVLAKFQKLAEAAGVNLQTEDLLGDPQERLCQYCKDHKADVLVLGQRRNKWSIMGSMSTYCCNHAPCSVLIYHAPEDAATA